MFWPNLFVNVELVQLLDGCSCSTVNNLIAVTALGGIEAPIIGLILYSFRVKFIENMK